MTHRRAILILLVMAAAPLPALLHPALAQAAADPGATGAGRHGGRHGGGGHNRSNPAAATRDTSPPLKRDPAQRLDPGALLCRTETALQQHQAAIRARLDGADAQEPAGCHLVPAMTRVDIVARHGPATTEVRLPGPPETTGWTDAVVRDGSPPTH